RAGCRDHGHAPRPADRAAVRRRWRGSARGPDQARSHHPASTCAQLSPGTCNRARLGLRPRRRAAPLILYFDTSALVKLVVVEPGSELVAELWGTRLRAASSILCYPEGRAALAAARRGRRLSATGYGRAREELESLQSELVLVGID